jgi:hypothetical protein
MNDYSSWKPTPSIDKACKMRAMFQHVGLVATIPATMDRLTFHLILGAVYGQVDAVKAGMRAREHGHVKGNALDSEQLDVAVTSLQEGESLHRNACRARRELEEASLVL